MVTKMIQKITSMHKVSKFYNKTWLTFQSGAPKDKSKYNFSNAFH